MWITYHRRASICLVTCVKYLMQYEVAGPFQPNITLLIGCIIYIHLGLVFIYIWRLYNLNYFLICHMCPPQEWYVHQMLQSRVCRWWERKCQYFKVLVDVFCHSDILYYFIIYIFARLFIILFFLFCFHLPLIKVCQNIVCGYPLRIVIMSIFVNIGIQFTHFFTWQLQLVSIHASGIL